TVLTGEPVAHLEGAQRVDRDELPVPAGDGAVRQRHGELGAAAGREVVAGERRGAPDRATELLQRARVRVRITQPPDGHGEICGDREGEVLVVPIDRCDGHEVTFQSSAPLVIEKRVEAGYAAAPDLLVLV